MREEDTQREVLRVKLNQCVRALRRERGMTQEQLAEAMNVSSAAVSKWESGQSVPDIATLTALADYFEVSLDALVGYEAHAHRREEMIEEIKRLSVRRGDEVIPAVREALRRYPNSFDVVWTSAKALGFRGMEKHCEGELREALALMDRALTLLPQNTDPDIRRESILTQKGVYCIELGEPEKAIDYYQQGNVSGMNDVEIGNAYAALGQFEKALTPLSRGMLTHLSLLYNAMYGLLSCQANMGDEAGAEAIARWCAGMLSGLEAAPGSYIYKMRSMMLICAAVMASAQGKEAEAREALEEAVACAKRFDAAPDLTTNGVRFYRGEERGMSDDVGEGAMDVLKQTVRDNRDERLLRWLDEMAAT